MKARKKIKDPPLIEPPKVRFKVLVCECCGRDFRVSVDHPETGRDGVTWCPACKPKY